MLVANVTRSLVNVSKSWKLKHPLIDKWLFQLDDEPHLYMISGCLTVSIHFRMVVSGSRKLDHFNKFNNDLTPKVLEVA